MALNMNTIQGTLTPINDRVIVSNMYFGEQTLKSGLIISDDNGSTRGIYPRWGQVHAKGPKNDSAYQIGDWVLIEHGRWTRGIKVEENGEDIVIRRVDTDAILLQADEKPNDVYIAKGIEVQEAVEAYRLENK